MARVHHRTPIIMEEAVVEAYLKNELQDDPSGNCRHHEGHRDCGNHDHCHE